MKLPVVLFSASLAANAALLTTLALRPSLVPAGLRDYFSGVHSPAGAAAKSDLTSPPSVSSAENSEKKDSGSRPPLWSTLDTSDLKQLVAQLKAAGFPIYAIRTIVQDRLRDQYDYPIRRLTRPDPNQPYWKARPLEIPPDRLAEALRLDHENTRILRDLLGDFAFRDDGDITTSERRRYGNLPVAKIDSLARIEKDYSEMTAQARLAMNNVLLPGDRAKLALLDQEQHADLATILTPEEMADYDMRNSPLTMRLRPGMTAFNPSESEFSAIYKIMAPMTDTLLPTAAGGSADLGDIASVQDGLNTQIKAALGDQRYADFVRSTDRDYQMFVGFEQQQNLPAGTALQAYNLRNALAQESTRILEDRSLDNAQKQAVLRTLSQSTRAQLLTTLGPVANAAYLKTANGWLSSVEQGYAVTFTTVPTVGTFPLLRSLPGIRASGPGAAPAKP